MADVDFEEYGGYGAPQAGGSPGRAQRLINLAGAASSLALVVGLAVWGYNLAVRDVRGVPVMRALDGPMRIAPEDPGGRVAAHQGLAVNTIAAAGEAGDLPETLTLAPRAAELDLDDEAGLRALPPEEIEPAVADLADAAEGGLEAAALAGASSAETSEEIREELAEELAESPALAVPAADTPVGEEVTAALADALAAGAEPLAPLAPPQETDATLDSGTDAAVAEALGITPEGGLVKSLRPRLRPERVASAPTQVAAVSAAIPATAAATAPTDTPAEINSAEIKTGTRLVQLGAFDTADQARGEWNRLRDRFPQLLGAKSLVVQSAESGGRTFYRLRAHGFDGEDDARRFCTALLAEGAACIPVAQR